VSYRDVEDWRAATASFAGLAAYAQAAMTADDEGHAPEQFGGAYMKSGSRWGHRVFGGMLAIFAVIALLPAGVVVAATVVPSRRGDAHRSGDRAALRMMVLCILGRP